MAVDEMTSQVCAAQMAVTSDEAFYIVLAQGAELDLKHGGISSAVTTLAQQGHPRGWFERFFLSPPKSATDQERTQWSNISKI